MNKKKMLYWGGGILLALILFMAFQPEIMPAVKRLTLPRRKNQGLAPDGVTPAANPKPEKTLKKGDSGFEVKTLQENLIRDGGKLVKYGADGVFGAETESALFAVTGKRQISLKDYNAGKWVRANTGILPPEEVLDVPRDTTKQPPLVWSNGKYQGSYDI